MSHLIADTCGTIAGAIIGKSVLTNFLSDYMEALFKRLFIHTKRQYIIWTHSVKHKDTLPEHTEKLFLCQDSPCDLLHKPPDDLGLSR
jgi:hypothetical protein